MGPIPDAHHFAAAPLAQPPIHYGSQINPMGYVQGAYGAYSTAVDTRKRMRHDLEQVIVNKGVEGASWVGLSNLINRTFHGWQNRSVE